ncbi:MAG: SMP-30/gluconolactonase/LRE family protein [Actinomycetota bacterium]|nr:SMP-30/gluconolactonase/LRE family protein [Actinomycetota bacterium]
MPELREVDVVADGLAFPEGPVAMADGSVIVVELNGDRITRVLPDGSTCTVAEVEGGPNGVAIGPDGALYVCNNGGTTPATAIDGRIQRVDLATGAVTTLYTECEGVSVGTPNDLVFDHTGNFWFTDHSTRGSVFYASPDGTHIRRVVKGTAAANGVGLSPDGSVLYWAETHTRQVHRRRITAPGETAPSLGYGLHPALRGKEFDHWSLLIGLPGAHALDSLAVDSSGSLCVGTLVDSGISEISPDGAWTLHTLPPALADGAVTNICFGGPDLRTAFITCSVTGRLVRATWHRPGLPLAFNA